MLWTWALVGCGPNVVCDMSQVPISDRQGFTTPEERLRIRGLLEKFERWSGYEVCLAEVELVSDLESHQEDLGGRWTGARRRIQLDDPSGLSENTVFHELCHAIDTDHAISERHADLFAVDEVEESDLYPTERLRRREAFARRCSVGPQGPVVALVEEACGDPTAAWIEREIWSRVSPDVELRLAESPTEKGAPRLTLPGVDWNQVGPRMLERDHELDTLGGHQAEVLFLDPDLEPDGPSLWVPWEAQLASKRWRTLWSDDQVMWAPDGGVPWLLEPGHLAREVDLPPEAWRGGWAGDSWWLWAPGRPLDDGLTQVDRDGRLVARYPLPSHTLGPVVEVDGEPWLQDLARHDNHVRDLAGEEVLTLPRDVLLSVQRGELLLGWYDYEIDYRGPDDIARTGLAWVDEAGIVYIESPCEQHDALPDRVSAPRVALEPDEDADLTEVIDQVRSYAVER